MAERAGPSAAELFLAAAQEQAAEAQRSLAEGDAVRRGLEQEVSRLRRALAEEQAERGSLEERLLERLEDVGDDVAQVCAARRVQLVHMVGWCGCW
jgi:chromosome segregation ATPase